MLRARVPEASVNEDRHAATWKDNVRRTALSDLALQPKPRASGMQCAAQLDFGLCADLRPASEVPPLPGADPALCHGPRLSGRPALGHSLAAGAQQNWAITIPVALYRHIWARGA